MRRYETVFIIDPELSDEGRDPIFSRLADLIQQHEGFLVKPDEWGARKLAYPIKKKARGYYVRLDYCGDGLLVNEVERFFRIDDRILKYMTVLLDKHADLDQIKEEIAKEEAERERIAQEKAERDRAAREAEEREAAAKTAIKDDAPEPDHRTETDASAESEPVADSPDPIAPDSDTEEK